MPNILFNFFIISTTNCDLLSDTILSSNPCNFHMLSLNNHTSLPSDVFMVFLKPCLTSTSLLVFLFYSSFSDIYHILLHIFPHLLLLLATNNSLLLIPLFFTFLYDLLPLYHDAIGLSLLSMLHSLAHIHFLLSTPSLILFAILLLLIHLLLPSSSLLLL